MTTDTETANESDLRSGPRLPIPPWQHVLKDFCAPKNLNRLEIRPSQHMHFTIPQSEPCFVHLTQEQLDKVRDCLCCRTRVFSVFQSLSEDQAQKDTTIDDLQQNVAEKQIDVAKLKVFFGELHDALRSSQAWSPNVVPYSPSDTGPSSASDSAAHDSCKTPVAQSVASTLPPTPDHVL